MPESMTSVCPILLFFLLQFWTSGAQINCLLPLPQYMVAWQTTPPNLQVHWDLSKVCHDSKTCFGQDGDPTSNLPHQLPPIVTQSGAAVAFGSDIADLTFYKTDESSFLDCNFSIPQTNVVEVNPTLQPGRNYFIAKSNSISWLSCEAGLRLNVSLLQEHRCLTVSGNICNSSGQCVAQPWESAYKCLCCQSHYGDLCEKVDGCYANKLTCMNGGTCIDGPDLSADSSSFTCKCIGGYTGRYCQSRNTVVCPRNECSNGGECNLNGSSRHGFTCTCQPGYHGNLCEVDVDECLSSPCLNNGTCRNGRNSYSCTCLEGFTGLRCENDERPCRRGVCFNGATCTVEDGRPRCECPIGFQGSSCMTEVLTCHHQPCSVHSTDCVMDVNNDFTCICKAGFTGQRCDINIDECLSNPCGGIGACVDEIAGYHCRCPDGSTGHGCPQGQQAVKNALEGTTDASSISESSSSSSSSPGMTLAAGVIVILVLVAMLISLVFLFVRYGMLNRARRRKIYAIEISDKSAKDKINTSAISPREFLGDDEYPSGRSCLMTKINKPLFRRNTKKTERF